MQSENRTLLLVDWPNELKMDDSLNFSFNVFKGSHQRLFSTVTEDEGYEGGENQEHLPHLLPTHRRNLPPHTEDPTTSPLQSGP